MIRSPEAPRRRWRAPRRVPAACRALLAIVVLVGLAWALFVPPWQSPDEVAHFAYVESLAARHHLPGTKGRGQNSTDQSMADAAVGASRGAFNPTSSPPSWSRAIFRAYSAAAPHYPRTDGGGPNPNAVNPPLYYLYGSIPYLLDHGGTAFGQLYAARLAGVLLLALTAVGGWLLAGEVLGRRRLAQLLCGAVVALIPMSTFMSTNVNPDALMIVLWTWALWLGARVVRRGGRRRDTVALGAVVGGAVLTKATSYALIVPALVAFLLGWWARPRAERRAAAIDAALGIAVMAGLIVAWVAIATALHRPAVNQINAGAGARPFSIGGLLSYVWQFYLPRLGFMTPNRETPGLPVYDIWVHQVWGTFGWLDVGLPNWLYPVLGIVTAIVLVSGLVVAVRALRAGGRHWPVAAFLLACGLVLLAFLHITDYRSLIAGQGELIQGRYLLPVVGLFGLAAALPLSRLRPNAQAAVCGIALVGLLALQVVSLWAVAHVYYA